MHLVNFQPILTKPGVEGHLDSISTLSRSNYQILHIQTPKSSPVLSTTNCGKWVLVPDHGHSTDKWALYTPSHSIKGHRIILWNFKRFIRVLFNQEFITIMRSEMKLKPQSLLLDRCEVECSSQLYLIVLSVKQFSKK